VILYFRRSADCVDNPGGQGVAGSNPVVPTQPASVHYGIRLRAAVVTVVSGQPVTPRKCPPQTCLPLRCRPWARRRFMTSCVGSESTPMSRPAVVDPQRVSSWVTPSARWSSSGQTVFGRRPGPGADLAANQHYPEGTYPADQSAGGGRPVTTFTKGNVGFQTQEIVLPQVRNFHESSYLRSHSSRSEAGFTSSEFVLLIVCWWIVRHEMACQRLAW
jgi:hypothetical protein